MKNRMSASKRYRQPLYTRHNKVQLVRGGKEYFQRLVELAGKAVHTLYVQVYILDDDETGELVAAALKQAAYRGVNVYLMADGYASRQLSRSFINGLRNAGVQFRFFDPLFKSKHFYFGRRLHHKIAVADGRYALTGGINITNRYNDMPGQPAWLDFALYVEGEVAQQLCLLCWKTWNGFPLTMRPSPCDSITVTAIDAGEECEVGMRRNDWVRRKNEISSTYVNMLRNARSHVTILCSYFLPGRVIRQQLAAAAARGVKIRVITAGVSDVGVAKYAERYMYRWLLRKGIELYEYQPNVLHGKIAVCDGEWLTIGSYNINNISAYASIELNLDVRNVAFAGSVEKELLTIMQKDCVSVTTKYQRQSNNPLKQLLHWLSYGFFSASFYLSTFYYKHKS
jgi:cardiolipin synthase A/B